MNHRTTIHNDDRPVGHVLSRREVLALFGGVGATVAAAAWAPTVLGQSPSPLASADVSGTTASPLPSVVPSCVVRPEMTEGPYFVDEQLERSDIRTSSGDGTTSPGAQLDLAFLVSRIDGSGCTVFPGAVIDVWHCDAAGVYSDVTDPGFDTSGSDFLRGYQVTDESGRAAFTTVYPGWYQGRTVHIHFMIRTDPDQDTGFEFTSQLFFDDAFTDVVFEQEPYAAKGIRTVRNDGDGIYQEGGDQLQLVVTPTESGYKATFEIGVQMT